MFDSAAAVTVIGRKVRCAGLVMVLLLCVRAVSFGIVDAAPAKEQVKGRLHRLDAGEYYGLSLSELCERFALQLNWEAERHQVTVKYGAKQVLLKEGDNTALAGANSFRFSEPVLRYGHDLVIPVDGALRLLGYLTGREYGVRETEQDFVIYRGEQPLVTVPSSPPFQPPSEAAGGMERETVLPGLPPHATERTVELIIIDPGRGGWETGAVSSSGLKEKELTLRAAKDLARIIEKRLGLKAVLTRKADYYLSLDDRIEIANTAKRGAPADLFVGLHVNAAFSPVASGPCCVSLPYYSGRDDVMEVKRFGSDICLYPLRGISDKWSSSSFRLAELVTDALVKQGKKDAYHLVDERNYILSRVDMPGVVVELGFLSNGVDMLELRQAASMYRLCKAIYSGIERYVQEQVAGVGAGD